MCVRCERRRRSKQVTVDTVSTDISRLLSSAAPGDSAPHNIIVCIVTEHGGRGWEGAASRGQSPGGGGGRHGRAGPHLRSGQERPPGPPAPAPSSQITVIEPIMLTISLHRELFYCRSIKNVMLASKQKLFFCFYVPWFHYYGLKAFINLPHFHWFFQHCHPDEK